MHRYWHLDDGATSERMPAWQSWAIGVVIVGMAVLTLLTLIGY